MKLIKNTRALTSLLLFGIALALAVNLLRWAWNAPTPVASSPTLEPSLPKGGKPTEDVQILTATQAKKLIDNEQGVVILDIQRRDFFEQVHIKSAINIPSDEVEVRAEDELSKADKIVIVDRSCDGTNTEGLIRGTQLVNLGFRNIAILDQGIAAWTRSAFDVAAAPVEDKTPG